MTFGSLQIALDRFQQDDGFASLNIAIAATVCVFSAVSLVWWELHHPQPVFDVRLFKVRSFAVANVIMFLLGFTLYSTTQLIPQLAQELLHYDALVAGQSLALGGLTAALMMPFAGLASSKISGRWLIVGAFIVSGLAFLHTSRLNLQVSFWDLSLARVYQSVALPFLFVTLTAAGYVGIPADKNGEASAIINLMRNLGGSVGVSIATAEVAWRTQFHHARLAEHVSSIGPSARAWMDPSHLAAAQQAVQIQAQALSYFDIFWLWGVATLCVAPIALILKNPPKGAAHGH
jgi:DHA2 family multidrug resistance protein